MSNNTNDITSMAHNYQSDFSFGVDARTGSFHAQLVMAKLSSLNSNVFTIKIGFNYLSSEDQGFGKGWGINISRYNIADKKLYLSDGRSFRVKMSKFTNVVECQYFKLKDIYVTHKDEALNVIYKDGTIEQFDKRGLLTSVQYLTGHKLEFEYDMGRIRKISYSNGNEIYFTYEMYGVKIKNQDDDLLCEIKLSNGKLIEVSLPEGMVYDISYEEIDGINVIKYIKHPSGATDKVVYQSLMKLPNGSKIKKLPAVIKHTTYADGIQNIERLYEYSSRNYLGYGISRYTPYVDNLFETKFDYTYEVSEIVNSRKKTQIFNKYHLLIEEILLDADNGNLINKVVNRYYCNTHYNLENQPPQYNFLKNKNVYIYDELGRSRVETESYEYDEYGNQISKIDSYGMEFITEYYPASGEIGEDGSMLAPASISGMPYLIKRKIEIESNKYKTSENRRRFSVTYKYGLFNSFIDKINYPVITDSFLIDYNGQVLKHLSYEYFSDNNPRLNGLILKKTFKEKGVNTTIQNRRYTLSNNESELKEECETVFSDGESKVEHITTSLKNGNVISIVDDQLNEISYSYDKLDRLVYEVFDVRENPRFSKKRTFNYITSPNRNELTIAGSNGYKKKVIYDALGQIKEEYETNTNETLSLSKAFQYDVFGNLIVEKSYDNFGAGHSFIQVESCFNKSNKITSKQYSNGLRENYTYNEEEHSITTNVSFDNEIKLETTIKYDENNNQIEVKQYDAKMTRKYDGFGMLISSVDSSGTERVYEYDSFGREIKSVVNPSESNLNDKLVLEVLYDDRTSEDWIVNIKANGISAGEQEYDAQGRVTSQTKGELVKYSIYGLGGSELPTLVMYSNSKSEIKYEYFKGVLLNSRIRIDDILYEHEYDDNGFLTREKINGLPVSVKSYYLNGLICSETKNGRSCTRVYSDRGEVIRTVDYAGIESTVEYDEHHRKSRIVSMEREVDFIYDGFQNVVQENISLQDGTMIRTSYTYDKMNKIKSRITTVNGEECSHLELTYNSFGKIVKSVNRVQGENVTSEYSYDKLGRVISYNVSDNSNVDFENIGRLIEQKYVFNDFGSIYSVTTRFINNHGDIDLNYSEFFYNKNNTLVRIENSNISVDNVYVSDNQGDITTDEKGRKYNYNALGQLTSVVNQDGSYASYYQYDSSGKLVKQIVPQIEEIDFFYIDGKLANEKSMNCMSSIFRVNSAPSSKLLVNTDTGKLINEIGFVTDFKGSVVMEVNMLGANNVSYDLYGNDVKKQL